MKIVLNEKAAGQVLAMYAASGLDCKLTHFVNLLIADVYLNSNPTKEDEYDSTQASMPTL